MESEAKRGAALLVGSVWPFFNDNFLNLIIWKGTAQNEYPVRNENACRKCRTVPNINLLPFKAVPPFQNIDRRSIYFQRRLRMKKREIRGEGNGNICFSFSGGEMKWPFLDYYSTE